MHFSCSLSLPRQKIGNFKTEPPGLFRGRGDHPKQGKIKVGVALNMWVWSRELLLEYCGCGRRCGLDVHMIHLLSCSVCDIFKFSPMYMYVQRRIEAEDVTINIGK